MIIINCRVTTKVYLEQGQEELSVEKKNWSKTRGKLINDIDKLSDNRQRENLINSKPSAEVKNLSKLV